jgi:hypothetical protein
MSEWRVFYFRSHRKTGEGERRDQTVISSESEPTVEQVAEATGDAVLRLDGVEELPEVS